MNTSVSVTRAVLILSACLVFGTLLGLMSHNSGQNLRSASGQEEQQQLQEQNPTSRGLGIMASQLREVNVFGRSALAVHDEEEDNRVEVDGFVWKGDFPDIQQQDLDTVDFSMDYSFDFEGSFSYDYFF